MTTKNKYIYDAQDVEDAYLDLYETVFPSDDNIDTPNATPRILIVAGVQGSGKTYLLENTLLLSGRYNRYVSLYTTAFRERHPQYAQMIKHGVLHAYEHTEAFVRELGSKLFTEALAKKHSIIMECALDDIAFADFPAYAARLGYQFEVHLIGCKKEFAHLSTIKRVLECLEKGSLERFVDIRDIEDSMGNAQQILTAFENACLVSVGSTITMYERGFGLLKNRRILCQSSCEQVNTFTPLAIQGEDGTLILPKDNSVRIERTPELNTPCSYKNYATIVNAPILLLEERGEALKECHLALSELNTFAKHIPYNVYNDLYAYIVRYIFR